MSVESPKTSGLVTMRYVIMSVLNRMNNYSLKEYLRLTQIAIEFFSEDLSQYHSEYGKEVVYLHMSTAKTVQLPADFIDWEKVGFPVSGKLRVITKHDRILLPRTFYGSVIGGEFIADTGEAVGNADEATTDDSLSSLIYFDDHFRGGIFVGGLYGLPGGVDDAYFRFDMENRQIVFSGSTPRSEIVLEYISTGLKSDGSSFIPRECVPVLRTYVLWQKDLYDPRVALNLKEVAKREHEESLAQFRAKKLTFTADEYLRMIYGESSQSPKR